ncbi:MAG: hypothetical protein RL329_247 [Bacteroidota bacterium]|jgi:hypothetical protein
MHYNWNANDADFAGFRGFFFNDIYFLNIIKKKSARIRKIRVIRVSIYAIFEQIILESKSIYFLMKKVFYLLLGIFLLAQFYRPERNLSGDTSQAISKAFSVPDSVQTILKTACYDCHSNKTVYPWYNNVQPVASWLAHHIDEAKHEINFDEFAKKSPRWQNHKMEEVMEQIEHNEMPLSSYTLIHKEAVLSPAQKTLVIHWAKRVMDTLKARNHPDSLILKRRH